MVAPICQMARSHWWNPVRSKVTEPLWSRVVLEDTCQMLSGCPIGEGRASRVRGLISK